MTTTAGNERFEALLVPALAKAYRVALCLTRNSADAEDLVQAASLRALRGFGTFEAGSNFGAWLYRVVSNEYVSRYRQARRRGTELSMDETPDQLLMDAAGTPGWQTASTDPRGELSGRMDAEQIVAAMRALPEKYRLVTTLYFVDDLTYEEIAQTLGIAVGTVRSRLHRGRHMLMDSLGALARDYGVGRPNQRAGGTLRRPATRDWSRPADRSGSPAPRSAPSH
jgi:RNA polymerase sigma-70 factor (ECF subfamily)